MGGPNFANIGVNSLTPSSITYGGMKWPDFVGALHVKQGWGEAQVSGVIHNVNVSANGYNSAPFNTVDRARAAASPATGTATISTTRSVGASTPA